MKHQMLYPILFAIAAAGLASAQSSDISNKPSVVVGTDLPRSTKPGTTRLIQGMVKDVSDNPVGGAIVQLKNTRTNKVVDFITKDDGKYVFRDLSLDIEYELLAKHASVITPVKKASPYDTRHILTMNFRLEPPEKGSSDKKQ